MLSIKIRILINSKSNNNHIFLQCHIFSDQHILLLFLGCVVIESSHISHLKLIIKNIEIVKSINSSLLFHLKILIKCLIYFALICSTTRKLLKQKMLVGFFEWLFISDNWLKNMVREKLAIRLILVFIRTITQCIHANSSTN